MPRVVIEPVRVRIGEEAVSLDTDLYYAWKSGGEPGLPVVLRTVRQWADALRRLGDEQPRVYLPVNPEDECIEIFRAIRQGDRVLLRLMFVATSGWDLDLDDLMPFMLAEHEIDDSYPEDFGSYDLSSLIEGCEAATLVETLSEEGTFRPR